MSKINRSLIAICLFMLIAGPLSAATQGRLKGLVKNSSGEAIGEAVVTITCDAAPTYEKVVKVDEDGEFSALILDATKTYIFHIEAPGYETHHEEFKIPVGTTDNHFDFVLKTPEELNKSRQVELKEQPGYKQLAEGQELFKAGNVEGAIAKYEEAVAVVPDLLPGWLALLEAYNNGDDHQRTLEVAEKCLEIDDEEINCLAVAAGAAKALGQDEKADQYLALYQELNPDDPTTLFNSAVEYLNKMDDAKARPILEECLSVNPEFGQCLYEYGMLLLRSGDMEGAKKHLQKYLDANPDGANAAAAADVIKYL